MQRIQQQALCAIRSYNTEKIIMGHKLRDGLSKQSIVGTDWYEFLCFGSPTALFDSLHNLFRIM